MRAAVVLALLLGVAATAAAQPAAPPNTLLTHLVQWDPPDPICVCSFEVSVDGHVVGVTTVNTMVFPVQWTGGAPQNGLHVVTVVAIDDQHRRSAPSTIAEFETTGTYIAPVAGAPTETRAIGSTIQGFNPIGPAGAANNQAERLALLKTWGWSPTVVQFVDGSVRADKTDRLFLIVTCVGLP